MVNISRTRVVVTGVGGAPYYLTGYWLTASGTTAQFAAAWYNLFNKGAGNLPAGSTWTLDTAVQIIEASNGQTQSTEFAAPASVTGTSAEKLLPHANQWLLRLVTGQYVGGRAVQGRVNIPLPAVAQSDNSGNPTTASATEWNTRYVTHCRAGTLAPVVWSRKAGQPFPVTTATTAPYFSILRSRRD